MPDTWDVASATELIEMVNDGYDDVLALVARTLTGDPAHAGAVRGQIDEFLPDALVITTDGPGGSATSRLALPSHLTSPAEFWAVVPELLARARAADPDAPLTEFERSRQELARVRTMLTTVDSVRDLHPHLREITFSGGDLETFAPIGPDTFLYVLTPPRGRKHLTVGRDFSWDDYARMPEAARPGGAYYTVRRWDATTHRLTMHFVLHGDEGSGSAWALQAEPGDPVALWGPRTAFEPPPGTEWFLLVADETGLPATAAILEQLAPGQRAVVFAEVPDADERQELPAGDAIEVTWCCRDGAAPGTTTALVDAVRAFPWPGGRVYAWGGAESHTMTAIRKYLRQEVGLSRAEVSMTGYWRRDTAH